MKSYSEILTDKLELNNQIRAVETKIERLRADTPSDFARLESLIIELNVLNNMFFDKG